MSFKTMAESIILQAMEDLDNPEHRAECLEFFLGYRFRLMARMARIEESDIASFRLYAGRYLKSLCPSGQPSRTDMRMIRKMAEASSRYRQPLFIHLAGSS